MTSRFKTSIGAFALTMAVILPFQALPAFAQSGLQTKLNEGLNAAAPAELKGGEPKLPVIIGNVISGLLGLLGVILFIYLLYGGFTYMTAGGDSKKVTEAVTVIKNAVIGMVIIALSFAIANFVIDQLSKATSATPGA